MTPSVSKKILTTAALAFALTTDFSVAGGWEHSVSVTSGAEHDSNPAMSATSLGSVWRARLIPTYFLAGVFERDEYAATLGLRAEQSSDEQLSKRRQDMNGTLLWGRAFDTGNLRLSASAEEASTRTTEFEDSGLVSRESTKRSYSAHLNGYKEVSETTSLTVGVSHTEAKYGDVALTGFSNQAAEVGLRHGVSESFTTNARLATAAFNPDGPGASSKTHSISIGLAAMSGERFNWTIQYGMRHTVAATESNGSNGSLSMQWRGAENELSLVVSRQLSPSSVGSMSVVDSVKGAWETQWGPNSKSSASLGVSKRHGALESEMAQATAAFIYEVSEVSNVRIYLQEKRVNQANSAVTATILGATLAYNWRP